MIHGRFQGLHIGHMEYLLEGKKRCDFLYIGITNPDASFIVKNDTDGLRSTELANPFTYFERLEMVRDAMLEYGIPREEFEIVPFPIHHPNLLHFYTPLDATYFLTIYDNRGTYKYEEFKKLKLKIDVMREKDFSEKTCS